MVDVICEKSGIPSAQFIAAIDHPEGDAENEPDFMLSCKEFDILCEHKLNSELGTRQLERYLSMPMRRPTRLILVTNRQHSLSDEVIKSQNYLRPVDTGLQLFFWEDFFPVIAGHKERLAQEFADYMRDFGMVPCPHPEHWKQLFHDRDVAEHFYEATKDLRNYFEKRRAYCKADSTRLGFQVRKLQYPFHLVYFYATKSIAPPLTTSGAPYIVANVFILCDAEHISKQSGQITLETEAGRILVRGINERPTWNNDLIQTHECIGSLSDFLAEKTVDTRENFLAFGRNIFEFVSQQLPLHANPNDPHPKNGN